MDELNWRSWWLFSCEFLGLILVAAFRMSDEEDNLVEFLDNLSRAMGLDEGDDD